MSRSQTNHIKACRNAWIKHHESCPTCTEWIDSLALVTPCPNGAAAYEEWQAAILAHHDLEEVTAEEDT